MCSIFYIDNTVLQDMIKMAVPGRERDLERVCFARDIRPTEWAPVLTWSENGIRLSSQRWGYPGIRNTGVIINARAESVRDKKIFENGIRYHRAVIPASHFYEWNTNKEKSTFRRSDGKVLYMAGFFDMLENEERFVILTTQANKSMQNVHDRMPLILEKDQIELWLRNGKAIDEILRQIPAELKRHAEYEQMMLFPV
ncbi:hypothetical protein B5F13_10935 [Drancourtella sp. An177]|nr:hypothetical protein B5F13_10935 [Drancourtella sp. An177]